MAFEIGSVVAHIKADVSDFKKGIGEAKSEASGLGTHLSKIGSGIADFGKQAAVFTGVVGAGLAIFTKQSIDAWNETEAVSAQTNAVIKSTGGAAKITAGQIMELSSALQKTTTYSDEAVQSSANLLLTFTQIKGPVFKEATATVLDMSAALGQDLKSSSIQLGKALNDPIQGVTALRRVGVSFSKDQLKQIEVMQSSGDIMGAQKLILKELATEFGGSAAAQANTFAGKITQLKNAFNDAQESIGMVIVNALFPLISVFQRLVPYVESFAEQLDTALALIGEAFNKDWDIGAWMDDDQFAQWEGFIKLLRLFQGALATVSAWVADNQELVLTFLKGLGIAIGVLMIIGTITTLIGLFMNPLVLVAVAIAALYTAWQTNFFGIRDITAAVISAVMEFFNNTLMPFMQAFVEWFTERWLFIQLMLEGVWNVIIGVIKLAWAIVYGVIAAGLEILSGDWKGAWERIKQATSMAWGALKQIFTGIVQFIIGWGGWLVAELVKPFSEAWNKIQDFVRKIKDALDFTKRHSPSVVDIVQRGVRLVNNSLEDLTMGINPTVGAVGQFAGAGMTSQAIAVNIDLNGAIIAGDADAMRISEKIGDSIIKKLKLNLRI